MYVGRRTELGAQLLGGLPVDMLASFRERASREAGHESEPLLAQEPDRHCGFAEVCHDALLMRGVRRMVVETGRSIFSHLFGAVWSRPCRPSTPQLTSL